MTSTGRLHPRWWWAPGCHREATYPTYLDLRRERARGRGEGGRRSRSRGGRLREIAGSFICICHCRLGWRWREDASFAHGGGFRFSPSLPLVACFLFASFSRCTPVVLPLIAAVAAAAAAIASRRFRGYRSTRTLSHRLLIRFYGKVVFSLYKISFSSREELRNVALIRCIL